MNSKSPNPASFASRNRGFTVIEAIIASVVLAVGLLALFSFQGTVQKSNAEAKVQAEAVSLAQGKLQELESFLTRDDARLDANEYSDTPAGSGLAAFTRVWDVEDIDPDPCDFSASESCLKRATVTVSWTDRDGNTQNATVSSDIRYRNPQSEVERFLAVVNQGLNTGEDAEWGAGSPPAGGVPNPQPGPSPGPSPSPPPAPAPAPVPAPPPVIASCGCYFQGSKYSLTSSGGACCSVPGCQSSRPNPKNKDSWTYSCSSN